MEEPSSRFFRNTPSLTVPKARKVPSVSAQNTVALFRASSKSSGNGRSSPLCSLNVPDDELMNSRSLSR